MKTITVNLYQYHELSEEAKKKARQWYLNGRLNCNWWDFIYQAEKEIGLEITSFDLYHRTIDGNLTLPLPDVLDKILANHGPDTPTYKLAIEYHKKMAAIPEDETQESEEAAMELEEEFANLLLKEYLSILQQEDEYWQSEEAIAEAMEANEYTFEEDGTRRD